MWFDAAFCRDSGHLITAYEQINNGFFFVVLQPVIFLRFDVLMIHGQFSSFVVTTNFNFHATQNRSYFSSSDVCMQFPAKSVLAAQKYKSLSVIKVYLVKDSIGRWVFALCHNILFIYIYNNDIVQCSFVFYCISKNVFPSSNVMIHPGAGLVWFKALLLKNC